MQPSGPLGRLPARRAKVMLSVPRVELCSVLARRVVSAPRIVGYPEHAILQPRAKFKTKETKMRKTSDCLWCDCRDAALRVEGQRYNSFLRHCEPAERRQQLLAGRESWLHGQCDLGWHRVCGPVRCWCAPC